MAQISSEDVHLELVADWLSLSSFISIRWGTAAAIASTLYLQRVVDLCKFVLYHFHSTLLLVRRTAC
jgi:hypothetical protein